MHISTAIATLSAAMFALTAASKTTNVVKRGYLVSDVELKHKHAVAFCKAKGGWPAVMDRENLREVVPILTDGNVTEAYIGKRLGSKKRMLKIVFKKGKAYVHKTAGRRKLPVLCQQEQTIKKTVAKKAYRGSKSKSSRGSKSKSSSGCRHRRSRRHRSSSSSSSSSTTNWTGSSSTTSTSSSHKKAARHTKRRTMFD